jgi:beta-glucosidase/6-phospho-beta-glucosidase/beta-galactosidase
VEDFVYYAEVVFRELGRYVQQWLTFNEPSIICEFGYKAGQKVLQQQNLDCAQAVAAL